MKVEQIYTLVNDAAAQALGSEAITVKDTSSLVSLGEQVYSTAENVDLFYKALVDRIGRTVIAIRPYEANRSPIRRDSMEFGIILQKISFDLPDAVTDPVWITDKQQSPYDVETSTKAMQRLFSAASAYSYQDKIPTKQMRSAFTNVSVMGAFISGIYTNIQNAFNVSMEVLDKLAVATGIAHTVNSGKGTVSRNLLAEFNTLTSANLTVDNCLTNADFLKYASREIGIVVKDIKKMSRIFNVDGYARFTPSDSMVVQMLSRFGSAFDSYLASDTFHKELIALPKYEEVDYWQGRGEMNTFDDVSSINITYTDRQEGGQEEKKTVSKSGILCYIHDIDTVATTVYDESVRSKESELSQVIVYQHEAMLGYLFDPSENGVVFYIAEE